MAESNPLVETLYDDYKVFKIGRMTVKIPWRNVPYDKKYFVKLIRKLHKTRNRKAFSAKRSDKAWRLENFIPLMHVMYARQLRRE